MTPNSRHIKLGYAPGNAPNYTGVTAPTFAHQWTLDALGNGSTFKQDSNGGVPGSWDLAQNRSHNQANETTAVSGYIGLDWADPVHDAAGNTRINVPIPFFFPIHLNSTPCAPS